MWNNGLLLCCQTVSKFALPLPSRDEEVDGRQIWGISYGLPNFSSCSFTENFFFFFPLLLCGDSEILPLSLTLHEPPQKSFWRSRATGGIFSNVCHESLNAKLLMLWQCTCGVTLLWHMQGCRKCKGSRVWTWHPSNVTYWFGFQVLFVVQKKETLTVNSALTNLLLSFFIK